MLKSSSKGKFQGMNFTLTKDAETSFHQLYSAFISAPILHHFDPFLLIRIKINASRFAISGILSQ